jgi:hypothetical protein
VEQVRAWSQAEIERVRHEATRRADERNGELDAFLRQHDEMVETEIEAVATAVRQYETSLDTFFADMTRSIDPAYIAHQADLIPDPPNLEIVRAGARSDTVLRLNETGQPTSAAETVEELPTGVGVGVFDPAAIEAGVGVGANRPNPAVRFLRAFAGWSNPSAGNTGGQPGQPR